MLFSAPSMSIAIEKVSPNDNYDKKMRRTMLQRRRDGRNKGCECGIREGIVYKDALASKQEHSTPPSYLFFFNQGEERYRVAGRPGHEGWGPEAEGSGPDRRKQPTSAFQVTYRQPNTLLSFHKVYSSYGTLFLDSD